MTWWRFKLSRSQGELWVDLLVFPFGSRRFFCRNCWALLFRGSEFCRCCFAEFDPVRRRGLRLRPHPLLKKIQVRSLWSWYPGEDGELSGFIAELKIHHRAESWKPLARAFLDEQSRGLHFVSSPILGLIPVPAHKPGHEDHAFLFAEALADELGVPVIQALQRLGGGSMRKRGRRERLEAPTGFCATQAWTEARKTQSENAGQWILVDDILTTGATSRDCLKALGLREAELWILATRERAQFL